MLLAALVMAAGFGGIASGEGPAGAPATAPTGPVKQIEDPGGKAWEFRPLPLPPLEGILKSARPNPFIYGLYTWTGEYKTHHESIKKVGWKAFRVGGQIDDDAMKIFVADDVEVMPTLAPGKEAGKPDVKALEGSAYVTGYQEKLAKFVERYGPEGTFFKDNPALPKKPIRQIEICNEPNFQYLIPPDGRPGTELEKDRETLYATLLPAAYAAIKAKSADVKVIGFGAGGSGAGDMRFIEHVHQKNPAVAKSYDVLSTHPYVEPAPPEAWSIHSWGGYSAANSLKVIRKTLEEFKRGDAPIWYTEVGWPISQADGGFFKSKGNSVSPMRQAAYVCRLYALAQRLGVERVDIMFATDTDNFNAGFFLRDGTWRPSAHAVQTMIHLMPAPKLMEVPSDGVDGMFIYTFTPSKEKGAKPVVMAWNVARPKEVGIKVDGAKAEVVDMLGTARQENLDGGVVKVLIGPYPVYVHAAE